MKDELYTIAGEDLVGLIEKIAYEDFIRSCPAFVAFPSIPDDAWHHAYEFIADLFDDNEENGTPCDEEARFNQNVSELLLMFHNRKQ